MASNSAWFQVPMSLDSVYTEIPYHSSKFNRQPWRLCSVPKVIHVTRYNMKCSGENETLGGIFHVVFRFPLHFMLYRGKFDYCLDSGKERRKARCAYTYTFICEPSTFWRLYFIYSITVTQCKSLFTVYFLNKVDMNE